jgi:glycosyltransferase involved in cell wall biosynthesis
MSSPIISVVIPTYRQTTLLQDAIESVLEQTFSDFEVVLVDNNSSSETQNLIHYYINKFPKKIRIVHEKVPGVCSARNRGIVESCGEFIALLDEDDLMKPQRLEEQLCFIMKYPDYSLVTCLCDRISFDGKKVISNNVPITGEWGGYYRHELVDLLKNHIEHDQLNSFYLTMPSTYFFRKETAIRAGLFDLRMNPQFAEDDDFQIRMFEKGPFYMIQRSLVSFRNSDSTPKKYSFSMRVTQSHRLLSILFEKYSNYDKNNIKILRQIYAKFLIYYGLEALNYDSGIFIGKHLLRKGFFNHPWSIDNGKLFVKTFFPKCFYERLFWLEPHRYLIPIDMNNDLMEKILVWPPS